MGETKTVKVKRFRRKFVEYQVRRTNFVKSYLE